MHITEITLTHQLARVNQFSWNHAEDLKRILSKHGWKSLGTGAEAAVAIHPQKTYVLKIFNSDSKYVDFVHFVQAHADNPHVPKFSRYVREVPGTQFSYVRMEKLQKITETQLMGNYINYLAQMMAMGDVTHISMLNEDLDEKLQDHLLTWYGYDPPDLLDPAQQPEIYQKLGGAPPQTWTHMLSDLAEHSEQHDIASWDMHAGNFMRRGKTLIIADPFY